MIKSRRAIYTLLALAVFIGPAWAAKFYYTSAGDSVPLQVFGCLDAQGRAIPATAAGTCLSSGGVGGSSDASAANQTSQITQETAINTVLGVKTDAKSTATDATSISAMSVLKQISASVQAPPTQAVTGTFWQATQPVSGTFWQATQPVSGPVTDAQLRATAVPVSGTFWQATQPVSGTFWQATQPVSGPLTDTQLRASPVPISAASLPLPSTAATSTKQSDGTQKTQIVDGSGNVVAAVTAGADGAANALIGQLTYARMQVWNGTTWDRLTSNANQANNADGVAAVAAGATAPSPVLGYNMVWNGSTWDRLPGTTGGVKVIGSSFDIQTDITRPADTTAYAASDALSDSTSAPTAGGFTLTGACRVSGGNGTITDAVITSSAAPATTLQAEIQLFDQAVTAVNDNAAYALSDADAKLRTGKIPFTLAVEAVNNSTAHVNVSPISYKCTGSANLRFLVRVINAYTPASGEVLTVRVKGVYTS